jgi:hypothetical protein
MRRSAVLASQRASAVTHDVSVVFDDEDPANTTLTAVVRPMGLSVTQRERLSVLAPQAEAGTMGEADATEMLELLVACLGSLVASWDLTDDDGTVVPLTPASLRTLGLDEVVILWGALQEAAIAGPFVPASGA